MSLAVISTHPIQYQAPVYRAIQSKYGIPVTVIYGSDRSVTGYRDKEFGRVFKWDTDLLSGYDSVFLSRTGQSIGDALKKISPEAVLISGYGSVFYLSALRAVLRSGYPVLFRAETTDHAKKRGPFKAWIRSLLLRRIYKRCAKLLYIGRNSYQHYKRLDCPDEKLLFSPYCVDTAPFILDEERRIKIRLEMRRNMQIREDDILLIFSGKLSNRKGPDLLLGAVKELPAEMRGKIAVLFLGEGKLSEELKKMAKDEIAVKAIFTGFKNQTELTRYYNAADMLILPSRHPETWGLVVNEALHHGLPCAVSKAVGCAPDLIRAGITGEICEIDSPKSLAMAIQRATRLINNEEIRRMCMEAVSGYTVDKAAEGIAEAYRAVIGDRQ